jgi:hypothetical protein
MGTVKYMDDLARVYLCGTCCHIQAFLSAEEDSASVWV